MTEAKCAQNEERASLKVKCRTCLGPGAVPLWEGIPPLAERVSRVARVKLRPLDPGPKLLCSSCLSDLDAACRFRARAKSADRRLRRLLADDEIKQEASSPVPSEDVPPPSDVSERTPDPLHLVELVMDCELEKKSDKKRKRTDSDHSYEPEVSESESIKSEHSEEAASPLPLPKRRGRPPKRLTEVSNVKLPPKPSRDPRKCHHCFKTLPNPASLKNHIKNHFKVRNHPCEKCGKHFKYPDNLRTHMMIHTGERPYACNLCKKTFNKKDNLELHRKRHFKQRNFSCQQCGSSHYTRYELKTHMQKHTGEKPHVCTDCGKSFTAKSNLYIHQHKHTGEKPYVCTVCGKRYTSKNILAIHSRIHTGEKPYICSVCGKRFAANKLAVHMRTHTGEKPHVCTLCGKQFSTTNVLAIHMRRHTGEKPYKCKICDQMYGHTQSLNKHMRKKHKILTDAMQNRVQQMTEEQVSVKEDQKPTIDQLSLTQSSIEAPLTGQESEIQSSTAPTLMITTTSTSAAQTFYIQHAVQDQIQLSAVNVDHTVLTKEVYKLDMKPYL